MRRLSSLALAALLAGAPALAGAQRPDTLRLALDEAVSRALRVSDEALIADAQVDLADAAVTSARATIFPQIRVTAGYTKSIESARAAAVGQIFNQPNTYTSNANFTQTLFQGGREFAGMSVARYTQKSARLSAAEVRAQVSINVQRAYLSAVYADRIVGIQSRNADLSAARLEQVRQLQAAGRAARYDVLRASVERANLEPLVIQSRSDRELALLELKRLLNIPTGQALVLTTSLEPQAVQAFVASAVRDTFVASSRASVQAAEFAARARQLGVRVARADLLPTVSVFFNQGYQAFPLSGFPTDRGRISNTFCPDGAPTTRTCNNGGFFRDRSVGVNLSWALFDGLRTKGAIDLAQAQAEIARLQLDQQREAVSVEAARARAEFNRARAQFEARRQTAGEAGESFQLASLRFTRGLGTQLDVSDAQVALFTAESNEARAVFDLYLAYAELARAEGRPIPLPPAGVAPPRLTQAPTVSGQTSSP